jgi:hypothetical protein
LFVYNYFFAEWKIPLWGQRQRWEDNIKMVRKEIGQGHVNWIYLAQNDETSWDFQAKFGLKEAGQDS